MGAMLAASRVFVVSVAALSSCASELTWPFPWPQNAPGYPLADVQKLSDTELRKAIEFLALKQPTRERRKLERCLLEVLCRDQKRWRPFLERTLERTRRIRPVFRDDLYLLTALRRSQGRRDPMVVRVDPGTIEAVYPDVPVIEVRLTNVDERSFGLADGPFPERWRLKVANARGNPVSVRPFVSSRCLSRGTCFGVTRLRPGKFRGAYTSAWVGDDAELHDSVGLTLTDYAQPQEPGTYSAIVQYHDESDIDSDPRDPATTSMVYESAPVSVTWKARTVQLSADDRKRIRSLIESLYAQARTALFERAYDPKMVFDGEPGSPAEAIYRSGYRALPVLFDELRHAEDPTRRARLHGMLASLTGFDPTPPCDRGRVFGPFVVFDVETQSGVTRVRHRRTCDDGRASLSHQKSLMRIWSRHRRFVRSVDHEPERGGVDRAKRDA